MEGLGGKEEKNFGGLNYFIPSWAGWGWGRGRGGGDTFKN